MNRDDATDLALEWAGRGLPAFPVAVSWDETKRKTNKRPLTAHGFRDAVKQRDVLPKMFALNVSDGADMGVGLWPGPPGYVVMDDDGGMKDSGLVIPETYSPSTASDGTHYWFRKRDRNVEIGNRSPWTGIDIRADHGYVMAPGTEVTLRVGGEWATFVWHDPGDYMVAPCPLTIWQLLQSGGSTAREGWEHYDPTKVHPLTAQAVEVFCTHLGGHHPRVVPGPPVHVQITRPGKGDGTSASIGFIGPGVTKVFTSSWPGLREGMVLSLRELTDVLEGRVPTVSAERQEAPSGLVLPPDVWGSREHLTTIRNAARTRLVAPDAVLGAVLARAVAFTDWRIKLPPLVGSVAGLSLLMVLLGEPEAGKSAAWAVAGELMPVPAEIQIADGLKYGSGEGWVESLLESKEIPREEGDKGPRKYQKVQKLYHALGWIDEGSRLTTSRSRTASTISETLRSIFSDQALGETNASLETFRHVDRGSYVFGVGMGLQPGLAGDLLGGSDAGDPQRWCWVWCHDPDYAPGPEWDGRALPWIRQTWEANFTRVRMVGGYARVLIVVPPEVESEVRQHRIDRLTGGVVDPLRAHEMLLRLKVAEAFALLDGRVDLTVEDWGLAGRYVAVSAEVRRHCAEIVGERQKRTERARRAVRVEDAEAINEHVAEIEVRRAEMLGARAIARKVHRAEGGMISMREAQQAPAGRDRKLASFEDMLSAAEAQGWVHAGEDIVVAGEISPPP